MGIYKLNKLGGSFGYLIDKLSKEKYVDLDYKVIESDDYLLIKFSGQWSDDNVEQFVQTTYDETIKTSHRKVLVDAYDVKGPLSEMARFFAGLTMAKIWGYKIKTAVFLPKNIYTGFTETVAVNRGTHARGFTNKEAALDWLL